MSLESTLVYSSRIVVAKFFVLAQLSVREKFMFMSKDFLVPRTEIAHDFVMHTLYMSVEIWPSQTCNVATWIRTIITKEQNGILEYLGLFVLDA